jgi:hypothetical protein
MPTDESYLDSLLNGLNSDGNKPDNKNRFSAYRKNKRAEQKEDNTPPETEMAPADEVNNEIAIDDFDRQPANTSDYYAKTDADDLIDDSFETGEIKNYNIFNDYDDDVIDNMINNELSDEVSQGELFSVSGENNGGNSYLFGDDTEEESPDEAEDIPEEISEGLNFSEEEADDGADEIYAPEPDNGSEHEALDNLFSDLFKDDKEETDNTDPVDELDDHDFFEGVEESDASDKNMEEHLADEVVNIVADDQEQPEIEENADDFQAEYEDPMEGFTFNAEETEEPDNDENNQGGISSMLGDMGVDTFNEDDLAALDDLLNEIDLDKPAEEEKKPKARKSAVAKDKLPWYIQLFGNVKIPEDKIKPEPTPEEIAKQKADLADAKKALKETKKAEKAEKKKAAAEAKALKARQTAEEKEAARKLKLEQASNMILEDVGNTAKLNKWGILVIFALFLGIVAVTVSGGSTLAYNIGVRQASKLFDNALVYQDVTYYTKAYDKIYGLDIEEEDYDLYDKILTVNYVNTQLNSYYNHALLDDYREGLNDLFKGLLRFRKWFAHATALGAQDDIYLVRSEIYKKLWEIYGIDESEAMFVLEHYDYLKETYGEYEANLYYTRYIYETVDRLGLGDGE